MMVNSKDKGIRFERELKKVLEEKIPGSSWDRVPMSGAIGTIFNESSLDADVVGKVPGFPKKIKVEAKVGYSRSKKSMTIKKEWIDKVVEKSKRDFSLPAVIVKFEGEREGKYAVILDLDTFIELIYLARDPGG